MIVCRAIAMPRVTGVSSICVTEPTVQVATTNCIQSQLLSPLYSSTPYLRVCHTSNIQHILAFLSHLVPGLSHDYSLTAVSQLCLYGGYFLALDQTSIRYQP